uniref:Uncharacterized protein n=1 Tax=Arundo donax TaxID=35708 RepID=A0A0A9FR94_ARUDO
MRGRSVLRNTNLMSRLHYSWVSFWCEKGSFWPNI